MIWQPIDTAPKDGTQFVAYDGAFMAVCYFADGMLLEAWEGSPFSTSKNIDCDATHWMPLPEPPVMP